MLDLIGTTVLTAVIAARSDLGRRAGPTLRAWVPATDFWRYDRLDCDHLAALVEHPDAHACVYLIMHGVIFARLAGVRGRSAS